MRTLLYWACSWFYRKKPAQAKAKPYEPPKLEITSIDENEHTVLAGFNNGETAILEKDNPLVEEFKSQPVDFCTAVEKMRSGKWEKMRNVLWRDTDAYVYMEVWNGKKGLFVYDAEHPQRWQIRDRDLFDNFFEEVK